MQNGTCYILAMIKRDDGERLLLGAGYYEFTREQKHFAPNQFQNDIVELQGTDGQLLAGQVRRSTSQPFDGYIGDGTTPKDIVEQKRREFFLFFRKQHHYTVVYIMPDGSAIKRDRGYITDAPAVQELYQVQPKWHVALAFEDVNYYSYAEDDKGNEIYSFDAELGLANIEDGGLIFDNKGAISTGVSYGIERVGQGTGNPIEANITSKAAQFSKIELLGETSQGANPTPTAPKAVQTVTGLQTFTIHGKNYYNPANDTPNYYIDQNGALVYSTFWHLSEFIRIRGGHQFTISGVTTPGQAPRSAFYNERHELISTFANGNKTITPPSAAAYIRFSIYATETNRFMFEDGNTATTYEAWHGTERTLNLGKNLFDKTKVTRGKYIDSTGALQTHVSYSVSDFVNVLGARSISTSGIAFIEASHGAKAAFYRADKTWMSSVNITHPTNTYEVPSGAAYFRTSARVDNDKELDVIQIELGDKPTQFAPYFTPITLSKLGDYQDRIYKDGDSWKIQNNIRAKTFDGTENWIQSGRTTSSVYVGAFNINTIMGIPFEGAEACLMDEASFVPGNPQPYNFDLYNRSAEGEAAYLSLSVKSSDASTISAFKTWLGKNTPTLYSMRSAPTTTTITDKNLIHQLDAIASARLEHGANTITAKSENLGATMDADWIEFDPSTQEGGYVWAPSSGGGPVIVTVNGVDSANPVWHVYGPATNPTLTNSSTGEALTWNNTVPANQELIIDMGNQTATLEGANVFEFVSGSWIQLKPGQNRISYTAANTIKSSRVYWNEVVG